MDLNKQIQVLIDDAPQDGVTPQIVAAIAPGLKLLAAKLRHLQYYILQSLEENYAANVAEAGESPAAWVVTTLSDRANPKITKQVIYAFPSLKDASALSLAELEPQVVAQAIPVANILFQLFALETVDSIIFFETPGDLNTGIEIRRADLQSLIQFQLQQNFSEPSIRPSQIPPDIA
jgi:hypothetical protein